MKRQIIYVFQLKMLLNFKEHHSGIFDIPTGTGKSGFQGLLQQHQNN